MTYVNQGGVDHGAGRGVGAVGGAGAEVDGRGVVGAFLGVGARAPGPAPF